MKHFSFITRYQHGHRSLSLHVASTSGAFEAPLSCSKRPPSGSQGQEAFRFQQRKYEVATDLPELYCSRSAPQFGLVSTLVVRIMPSGKTAADTGEILPAWSRSTTQQFTAGNSSQMQLCPENGHSDSLPGRRLPISSHRGNHRNMMPPMQYHMKHTPRRQLEYLYNYRYMEFS